MEKEYQERNIKIEEELKSDLNECKTLNDLVMIKAKYLGKNGIVSDLTKNMRDLSSEETERNISYFKSKFSPEILKELNGMDVLNSF